MLCQRPDYSIFKDRTERLGPIKFYRKLTERIKRIDASMVLQIHSHSRNCASKS